MKLSSKNLISVLNKYGIIVALVAIIIIFSIVTKGLFISRANILNIILSASITIIIAMGVTFSVAVGGFDLSAGSIVSLAAIVVASMFVWYEFSMITAILITLGVVILAGALNAFIIIKLKIPDMLSTLGTQFIIGGLALSYSSGKIISKNMIMENGDTAPGQFSAAFLELGQNPWIILIMVVVVIFAYIFLNHMKQGRYIYVIGGNPEAAELSGVNTTKYKAIAYILSAICAGIGGILLASKMGQANPGAGASYLMEAVASTFIGLSFLNANKANAIGTLLGTIIIVALISGLTMISMPYYTVNIVKGVVLVLALALSYTKRNN